MELVWGLQETDNPAAPILITSNNVSELLRMREILLPLRTVLVACPNYASHICPPQPPWSKHP